MAKTIFDLREAKNSKAGDELMAYAKKSGGIDKKDFMKAAGYMNNYAATGNPGVIANLAKLLGDLDTEPMEKIVSVMHKNDPALARSVMKKAGIRLREETEELEEAAPKISMGKAKGTISATGMRGKGMKKYDVDIKVVNGKLEFRITDEQGKFQTVGLKQAARMLGESVESDEQLDENNSDKYMWKDINAALMKAGVNTSTIMKVVSALKNKAVKEEVELEEARKYTPPTKAEIEADKRKDQRGKSRPSMSAKSVNKSVYKNMMGKLKEETEELEEAKFTDKQIKQAYGIINDPRWKSGNMTHVVNTIEKIAKGLSKHPGVQKALKATNESTAAYGKSQEKIANDKKKANIKPGELNKLAKIRSMLDKEKKK